MNAFRVILVETLKSFRADIASTICSAPDLPPLQLDDVDSAASLVRALEAVPPGGKPYDLAIVSLDLPHKTATTEEVLEFALLRARFPLTSFIIYSASDHLAIAQHLHAAGAAGYFRRDSPPGLILQVINVVLGGEAFALPDHLRSNRPLL